MLNRSYSELIKYSSFEDRFRYLKLNGVVGRDTFGHLRYLNQQFYRSKEWKRFKRDIILRDDGFDLGIEDRYIFDRIIVHHIIPATVDDYLNYNIDILLNPNNVICASFNTHEAIHYGDESLLPKLPKERTPGDTKLW